MRALMQPGRRSSSSHPPLASFGQGVSLKEGDASALKRQYHRLAARLHPDKVRDRPLNVQVAAEEVFKLLSIAYNKEMERLLKA